LENQIQLATVKEKEVVEQKEAKNKHDVETSKWKAITLEHSVKAILYDQLFEN
jgi:hypothetical protein